MDLKVEKNFMLCNPDAVNAVTAYCKANKMPCEYKHKGCGIAFHIACDTTQFKSVMDVVRRAMNGKFIGYTENLTDGNVSLYWRD